MRRVCDYCSTINFKDNGVCIYCGAPFKNHYKPPLDIRDYKPVRKIRIWQ